MSMSFDMDMVATTIVPLLLSERMLVRRAATPDARHRLEVVVRDGLWLCPAHRFHHEAAQPQARALQAMSCMGLLHRGSVRPCETQDVDMAKVCQL